MNHECAFFWGWVGMWRFSATRHRMKGLKMVFLLTLVDPFWIYSDVERGASIACPLLHLVGQSLFHPLWQAKDVSNMKHFNCGKIQQSVYRSLLAQHIRESKWIKFFIPFNVMWCCNGPLVVSKCVVVIAHLLFFNFKGRVVLQPQDDMCLFWCPGVLSRIEGATISYTFIPLEMACV